MLEALHNAGVLDGIARYIAAHWSDFDFEDATLFVAAAVDRLYAKIRAGEHVRNVSAFLFKVALNKASDAYEEKKHHVSVEDAGELPDRAQPGGPAAPLPRAQLVAKALELARSFLPELGQENIQRVMAFDLEAVQKGVEDLPAKEVADALALTESTVRQCRSRVQPTQLSLREFKSSVCVSRSLGRRLQPTGPARFSAMTRESIHFSIPHSILPFTSRLMRCVRRVANPCVSVRRRLRQDYQFLGKRGATRRKRPRTLKMSFPTPRTSFVFSTSS